MINEHFGDVMIVAQTQRWTVKSTRHGVSLSSALLTVGIGQASATGPRAQDANAAGRHFMRVCPFKAASAGKAAAPEVHSHRATLFRFPDCEWKGERMWRRPLTQFCDTRQIQLNDARGANDADYRQFLHR